MDPVRIRLYGLVSVTKRGYLIQLVVAAVVLAGLLLLRILAPPLPDAAGTPSGLEFLAGFLRNLHWIVLALAALFALEAYIVLRRFGREEAKRRADQRT